jgi:ABC-type transport system involved in multi-copper enzyme maturation permease subunit
VARVFHLAFGQLAWSRRTMFLGVVVGAPVLLAVGARLGAVNATVSITVNGAGVDGSTMFETIVWVLFLRFVVPVLGVWYGTSLIADEVDEKTITYLFVRPVRRGAVVLGKYLAYLACTTLVVLPAVTLVYAVGVSRSSLPAGIDALRYFGILTLGLAAYGALFTLMGAVLKRPLVSGLVFAFGWEQVALIVPGYLRRFTLAYHLERIFQGAPEAASSLFWLTLVTAGCLLLATRAVERREYVLEQ